MLNKNTFKFSNLKLIAVLYCTFPLIVALIVPRITNVEPEKVLISLGAIWAVAWPLASVLALMTAYRSGLSAQIEEFTTTHYGSKKDELPAQDSQAT